MANLKVVLELDNQGYIRGIKASEDAVKRFGAESQRASDQANQGLTKLNQSADSLTAGFGKLRGALLGLGLGAFAVSALRTADAVSDLSDATDISISKILQLRQALQNAGGEGENVGRLLTDFAQTINEAAQGGDKAQESFARVGVSLKDLRSLSEAQLLDQAIAGLAKIDDFSQRAAISQQLFGKAMRGVSPEALSSELERLRGEYQLQEAQIKRVAETVQKFEEAIFTLKLAVVNVVDVFSKIGNAFGLTQMSAEKTAAVITQVFVAALGVTMVSMLKLDLIVATMIKSFLRLGAVQAGVATLTAAIASKNALIIAGGVVAAAAAAAAAYKMLSDVGEESQKLPTGVRPSQAGAGRGFINPPMAQPGAERAVEVGKELQNQLNAVNQLAEGYRRAAQANMDRYTLEVELLGKTKEEQDLIKGTAEINKRYADQTAALEEKRKNAKGAVAALIDKEIANLEQSRISELDIFEITQGQLATYRRQQQEIKNIIELQEIRAEGEREIAEYLSRIDQSILAAYEQVKGVRENLQLTEAREQLERSIALLRGTDQAAIRKIFDLEQGRRQELEKIANIKDLPYDERIRREKEINDLYDQRRQSIENLYVTEEENSKDFTKGLQDAMTKYRNTVKTEAEYAADIFESATRGMEDAIVKFAMTGKLSFRDMAQSIIADIIRIQVRRAIVSAASIFGFANGGPVQAGKPIIVGERGPEMFLPRQDGKIISNADLKAAGSSGDGGGMNITYNINAVDAQSFRTLVARDPQFIYSVTEAGRRAQPSRRLA